MEKRDIPYLSTAGLAELIRQKEVSPMEVTESYLERIDDLNFNFNSYLTVYQKGALQAAQEAEQAISKENYLGPMRGIPVAGLDQRPSGVCPLGDGLQSRTLWRAWAGWSGPPSTQRMLPRAAAGS